MIDDAPRRRVVSVVLSHCLPLSQADAEREVDAWADQAVAEGADSER